MKCSCFMIIELFHSFESDFFCIHQVLWPQASVVNSPYDQWPLLEDSCLAWASPFVPLRPPSTICCSAIASSRVSLQRWCPFLMLFSDGHFSITGVGSALIYTPGIVIVGQYFEKRRGLAAGLSAATSGLGTFAFPPLAELLFDNYAFMGGFLILGALALNACVSAALYRPLEESLPAEKRRQLKRSRQRQQMLEKEKAKESEAMPSNGSAMIKKAVQCPQSAKSTLSSYIDLDLLKNPSFICFALSSAMAATSNLASIPLIVDHGRDCGIPEHRAVFLVSAVGIADTMGRALGGVLFDLPFVKGRRRLWYCGIIFMAGAAVYLWAMSSTFELLVAFCVLQVGLADVISWVFFMSQNSHLTQCFQSLHASGSLQWSCCESASSRCDRYRWCGKASKFIWIDCVLSRDLHLDGLSCCRWIPYYPLLSLMITSVA